MIYVFNFDSVAFFFQKFDLLFLVFVVYVIFSFARCPTPLVAFLLLSVFSKISKVIVNKYLLSEFRIKFHFKIAEVDAN